MVDFHDCSSCFQFILFDIVAEFGVHFADYQDKGESIEKGMGMRDTFGCWKSSFLIFRVFNQKLIYLAHFFFIHQNS